jgi:hypothetical protein
MHLPPVLTRPRVEVDLLEVVVHPIAEECTETLPLLLSPVPLRHFKEGRVCHVQVEGEVSGLKEMECLEESIPVFQGGVEGRSQSRSVRDDVCIPALRTESCTFRNDGAALGLSDDEVQDLQDISGIRQHLIEFVLTDYLLSQLEKKVKVFTK